MEYRKFEKGLTVRELKEALRVWPEENKYGEPYEVWIETSRGMSSIVTRIVPLNKREDGADMILESSAFDAVSECFSTHGGSGYAPGSYMDGEAVVCGACGLRIEDPMPTGWDAKGRPVYGSAVSGQAGVPNPSGVKGETWIQVPVLKT